MSKLFSTIFRQKAELEDGKLIKDYFAEYRDRNFMLINILSFNGTSIPCHINREDYRNNNKNFPIYTVNSNEEIPRDSFTRFYLLPKDNKIVEISESEDIYNSKYKGKTFYKISEFITFKEMFHKELYDTFIINDAVCNLVSIKHNGVLFVFDFFDLNKGKVITIDSNNVLIQQNIIKSLSDKKCPNKQQYILMLCNILMHRLNKNDLVSSWSANDILINALYRSNISDIDKYRYLFDDLKQLQK